MIYQILTSLLIIPYKREKVNDQSNIILRQGGALASGSAAPLGAALSNVSLKDFDAAENHSGSRTKSALKKLSVASKLAPF